jgi:nicotinamidase-related amidase
MLIDFQHDFLAADGRMPIARHQLADLIATTNRAIAQARTGGLTIVAVGNEFDPADRLMNVLRRGAAIAGSKGAAWDARVPIGEAAYFAKQRGDAFSNASLHRYLAERDVDEVILTGVYAKACVTATARGARAAGLRVVVLKDAVADAGDREKARALHRLSKIPGITIATTPTPQPQPAIAHP